MLLIYCQSTVPGLEGVYKQDGINFYYCQAGGHVTGQLITQRKLYRPTYLLIEVFY